MNAEAGVPVGDTTLLVNELDGYIRRVSEVRSSLDEVGPAIELLTLLEDVRAALAPFVGEATQPDG